jgi:hypothetical protein
MINSLCLASKSNSSLFPASSLKCLSMLIGTIVLRDSFPNVSVLGGLCFIFLFGNPFWL